MSVSATFPKPQEVMVNPKGKIEKLTNEICKAMLFPENQPMWRLAGYQRRGFNVRLNGTVTHADIRMVEPGLMLSGWLLEKIKYRNGYTYLCLVDAESVRLDEKHQAKRKVTSDCQYMLDNTDNFISAVFAGEPNYADSCSGMVAAHGDKSEQYRNYWHSSGIDFKKAQIIYFLTYTKLMDRPKWLSKEWVVDNYDKYAAFLP